MKPFNTIPGENIITQQIRKHNKSSIMQKPVILNKLLKLIKLTQSAPIVCHRP